MRIRFLTSTAGANFSFRPGKVYDVHEVLARRMIDARLAVLVEELAVMGPPETAARRTSPPRGRARG